MNKIPWWKLLFITIPYFGISFSWAIQIGHTSVFLLLLGMDKKWLSYTWLAGPISGTIIQPIVGVLSDLCWIPFLNVRRQLYLWIGALVCAASLITFSWSDWIGRALGDDPMSKNHPIGILVAVISFFVLDVSINLIQGPIRVLLVDLAPPEQHTMGSSLFSLFNGLGNTLGFLVGAVQFTNIGFLNVEYNIRPLYFIGAVVILFVVILNTLFIREQKHTKREDIITLDEEIEVEKVDEEINPDIQEPTKFIVENEPTSNGNSLFNAFKEIWKLIRSTPRVFFIAFMAQSFCYIANFALYIYGTVYFAIQIYGGDCDAREDSIERRLCDEGVLMGNLALSMMAFLSIPLSLLIGYLSKVISIKWIWFTGQIVQGLCLLLCSIIFNKYLAFALISVMSLSLACMMSIPWSVCSAAIKEMQIKNSSHREGFFLSVFNLSQCLPEFIVGLGGGLTVYLFVEQGMLPIGSQLALYGAIGGLGSAFFILFVNVPKSLQPTVNLFKKERNS